MEKTNDEMATDLLNVNKPVALSTPIFRGKTEIKEVLVTKPDTGALRGVRLGALLEMDVTAIATVLPRVTTPTLIKEEIDRLDPADFLELGIKVIGFFTSKSDNLNSQNY